MLTEEQLKAGREKYGITQEMINKATNVSNNVSLNQSSESGEERQSYFNNLITKKETTSQTKGTIGQDIKGIFTGIKEDLTRRGKNIKELTKTGVTAKEGEEQTGAETGFQIAGQLVGGVEDIVGRTIIGAIKAFVPAKAEEKISEAGKKLLETELGIKAMSALSNGFESYQSWKQENPRFAANLEASLNIADLAWDIATVGTVTSVKKVAKESVEEASQKIGKIALQESSEKVVKKGAIQTGLENIAKTPVGKATKDIIDTTEETITRTLLDLNKKQFKAVMKDPGKYRELIKTVDREGLVTKVTTALKTRRDGLFEMAKEYNPIRKTGTIISENTDTIFKNALESKGIGLKDGLISITSKSREGLSTGDISKLEDLLKTFKGNLDADEFLNLRHQLSVYSNFDSDTTSGMKTIAKNLRHELNNYADEIPGLKALDKAFADEKKLLDPIIKKIFNKDGELKDTAMSTISNLDSKNKKILLDKFSTIIPDLEENLNILKIVEGIDLAQGTKTGSYTKGILRSAGVAGGIASGNPLIALISLIATSPKTLLILMDGAVTSGKYAKNIIDTISNKMIKGASLSSKEINIVLDVIKSNADDVAISLGRKGVIEELEK